METGGCGKSYFVKHTLIDVIDKKEIPEKEATCNQKIEQNKKSNKPRYYQSVLVSLYGVSEVDSIQNAIYTAFLEKFTDNVEDARAVFALKNAALFGMIALKGVAEHFNVKNQADLLASKAGEGLLALKKENIVLIFDDIERCQIDIVELMGFLNNLCENNGYRVILIANEDEIARHENVIATAINSQTALIDIYKSHQLFNKIDSNKKKESPSLYNTHQQDKEEATQGIGKNFLKSHREELLERNTQYERTREKLIGLTIRFNSRIEDIYEDILNKTVTEDKTKNFLKSRKEFIISAFQNHSHENLRTLISIFIAVETMRDVFNVTINLEEEDSKAIDTVNILQVEKDQLLAYIIFAAINRVNGILPTKLAEGTRYGYINNGLFSKGKKLLRYAFVDEYWDTLVLNLNDAKTDFYNHVNESIHLALNRVRDREHYNLALYRLKEWYYFSDEKVLDDIKRMKQELSEKKYYPCDFKDIVYTLMCINNVDFGMKLDKDVESSNEYIYDATDESTFLEKDNDYSSGNKEANITAIKAEYEKWHEVNINEYVDLMLKYTDDEGFVLTSDMLRLLSESYDFAKQYRSYIQPLLDWINKQELAKLEKTDEGYDAFDIDSEELYIFFRDRRNSYITKKRFLSLYGYEDIMEYIRNSSVKGLLNFADALNAVYNFGNLRDFFQKIIILLI